MDLQLLWHCACGGPSRLAGGVVGLPWRLLKGKKTECCLGYPGRQNPFQEGCPQELVEKVVANGGMCQPPNWLHPVHSHAQSWPQAPVTWARLNVRPRDVGPGTYLPQ